MKVWLVLVLVTCLSSWLAEGSTYREAASVTIIFVAFVKIRLIGRYFMELRYAPLPLRLIFGGWCATACLVVAGIYFVSA